MNKFLALLIFLCSPIWCQQGYVTDPSHVLSDENRAQLEAISQKIEAQSGIQIATVIVPTIGDESIDDYANKLFEKLGVGQKGKDNGVLFVVALKEKKMRIEVGYGLEGVLPDGKAGEIRDGITPYFKQGDIAQGIMAGHVAIARTVMNEEGAPPPRQKRASSFSALFVLLALFLIFAAIFRKGGGGGASGFWGFLLGMLVSNALRPHDRFGGFGGSGFGGFGGGSSGGGGASGGW